MTNRNHNELVFDKKRYRLTKGLDLSGLPTDINTIIGNSPGSSYQSTRLADRVFTLEFRVYKNELSETQFDQVRAHLYQVCNPTLNPMRIDFNLGEQYAYYFYAHLEATPIMPPDQDNNNSVYQKVLLQCKATDPFIYAADVTVEEIAAWVPNFQFPLDISPTTGIEMGYKTQELIKNVRNVGSIATGMIIEFKAIATVVNPWLINVNSYQKLKANITLQAGDILRINTNRGEKSVVLQRNNHTTDAFHTLDITSDFLQLEPGDNLFRYDATSGIEGLEVRMIFKTKYMGV